MTGSAVVSPFRSTAALLWTARVSVRPVGYPSNMCSGARSGAAGSAGGGGAVDAGCLDPMLDRLVAVEVAGLPDEALAADLVGLRVAVSRLESEFSRRLVGFGRRGAAGVTGAVEDHQPAGELRLQSGDRDPQPHQAGGQGGVPVSYTHLRAHETPEHLVCRL